MICFVFLGGTCCYHAQRGICEDKTGEHGLLFSAANHSTSFNKVVTVDDVPLFPVLVSLGCIQFEVLLVIIVAERMLVFGMMGNANVVPAVYQTN